MKKTFVFLLIIISTQFIAQSFGLGTNLVMGQIYSSSDRKYKVVFQNDGNLVILNRNNIAQWSSRTDGKGKKAVFQMDGNFVVYDSSANAVFSSNTNNKNAIRMDMQTDGNLVIYNRNGTALWASQTSTENGSGSSNNGNYRNGTIYKGYVFEKNKKLYSTNMKYYITFQNDGNLVLYSKFSQTPLWSSKTDGYGNRAEFQNDGNLVVYNNADRPVFYTNTEGTNAQKISIQNDGNLVIYDARGIALWDKNK
ncbi:hypothetical protein [Epilithonimonas hungarica]|uniref:D-mannose binding lectin n=1 Tax=Epilithonimonas hungarica TaxID=454006 RepID=A0A1G7VHC2_9FLAO|nr:hypothetical protein [Epilithonimonas hungarica]SDG59226.1 D-mannose binding lectin [Epilithonimonas hungarica]